MGGRSRQYGGGLGGGQQGGLGVGERGSRCGARRRGRRLRRGECGAEAGGRARAGERGGGEVEVKEHREMEGGARPARQEGGRVGRGTDGEQGDEGHALGVEVGGGVGVPVRRALGG
ncbi:hypothetical protein A6V37_38480 [Paraburkholderia ginsengiterrae]|uniref:Uncharacterized protein n=1 Tax=Paraburkholderia ginsengiterrae TaxID=1462993 RepID=A0A1A9N688_9BURK|nr:hypothetical protein A6V37_38480 [Paraburkholderia ginsengiterrae]